ncbi:ATP-dependent protease La [Candidatus Desulforudis audaxviator MP104C]|uniref:ATP-dependent protease La n=1 Tax=Desulforudis audaxviator (strain MP104C) TaxID=477974 RepID=B1I2V2_DESAP|nr:BREX system Lon protease-like protein BrxL [Candidatus Desulforudis audaxviator]ACA59321.1 ATP-dependent protease La [Candidatus Desulforudis audaxviator MP104C]
MTQLDQTIGKMRSVFSGMVVYKNPQQNSFFQSLNIPPYLRDWLTMKFGGKEGKIDSEQIQGFVSRYIPRRRDWERLKVEMIKEARRVRFLAKVQVTIDVQSGEGLFHLPDLGFPRKKYEARIAGRLLREKKEELLVSSETWGVIELEWVPAGVKGKRGQGSVVMIDFTPFRPYTIDVDFYREARREFSVEEWIDVLLLAVDYHPAGFLDERQKLALLSRLLPLVEKRVNLVELAPKGTGKSYLFSQISKYGWLVSGGSVSRARLFYDLNRRETGLVSRYDYVALDEIQSISFPDEEEIRGALKGYLESGEYRVGDQLGVGEAGLVLLGNISYECMDENKVMLRELPAVFQESALLDRFHGFIKGWNIPRMRENLKAEGWGLNTEYFSEVMHALRDDVRYASVVDELLRVPKGADTRDTRSIKRLTTAWLKLLFPHVVQSETADRAAFDKYCLTPALMMRGIIRRQLHLMDAEYADILPEIVLAGE